MIPYLLRDFAGKGIHQHCLSDTGRAAEQDDTLILVELPQQCDQFRREAVPLEQVDGRHHVGGLLADRDVRAVFANGRQRDGTADRLRDAGRAKVDLRACLGGDSSIRTGPTALEAMTRIPDPHSRLYFLPRRKVPALLSGIPVPTDE